MRQSVKTRDRGAATTVLAVRREKGKVWSHVRQKWLNETPEETVRQEYLCILVNEYGFALDQIAEEMEVTGRGAGHARADFVIWRSTKDKLDSKNPLIIVECKSDNVTITPADYGQGDNYSRLSGARFFVTHNTRETKFWRVVHEKMPKSLEETLGEEVVRILSTRKENADPKSPFVFPGDGESGHLVEPKKGWKRIYDRDELAQLTNMISEAGGRFTPVKKKQATREIYELLEARLQRARVTAIGLGLNTEQARIHDIRIHDLRRTLGSWQAITGASLPIIGKSLNHKSQQATAIYARLDLDPVRASIEKATSAIFAAAEKGRTKRSGA